MAANTNAKGYVLIGVLALSIVLLTGSSIWFSKVVFISIVSKNLLQEKTLYVESSSLIPYISERLEAVTDPSPDVNFLDITGDSGAIVWKVSRDSSTDKGFPVIIQSQIQSSFSLNRAIK